MLKKFGHVSNPLTIIAIFAGFAKVSGTLILPFISDNAQGTYIWFLMIFPTLLVCLFFYVLWKKPKVLYAPSYFKNDESYLKIFLDDFEDNKSLSTNIKKVNESIGIGTITTIEDSKAVELPVKSKSCPVENIPSSCDDIPTQLNYSLEAVSFYRRIPNILHQLRVGICEIDGNVTVYRKDGNHIPIKAKYYQESLTSKQIISKLISKMKSLMIVEDTDESILLISSDVPDKSVIKRFSTSGVHIVTGNSTKVLLPQLKSILD